MSAVLCLPACLCVSAAASRGQAPHGNASVPRELCKGRTRQHRVSLYVDTPVPTPTIVHPLQAGERVDPYAGPHASGVDVPRQALHAQNRRYVPLVACDHPRSMAHVHEKCFGETPMENGVFVLHLSRTGIAEGYWMSGCQTESRRTVGRHPTRCYQRCRGYQGAEGSTACCAPLGHCLEGGWLPFGASRS